MQKSRHIVASAIELEVGSEPMDVSAVRDVVISTQVMENYGAHDWDGEGECPQYWKPKFGDDYIVTDVPASVSIEEVEIAALNDGFVETRSDDYYHVYVAGVVDRESGFQTWFEKSQMEYEGRITCPAVRKSWTELKAY